MGRDLKEEFRELLHSSGWTQAEAARRLAMTPSALSQIVRENSPVRPSLVTLRLFGLLLLRKKSKRAAGMSPAGGQPSRQWEKDLIREMRRLPPSTRRPILSVLNAMIGAARSRSAPGPRRARRGRQKGK